MLDHVLGKRTRVRRIVLRSMGMREWRGWVCVLVCISVSVRNSVLREKREWHDRRRWWRRRNLNICCLTDRKGARNRRHELSRQLRGLCCRPTALYIHRLLHCAHLLLQCYHLLLKRVLRLLDLCLECRWEADDRLSADLREHTWGADTPAS